MLDTFRNWLPFSKSGVQPKTEWTQAQHLIHFLVGQISVPGRAGSILERVEQFDQLAVHEEAKQLPGVYLLLEQYLAEVDPLKKYARGQLRDLVRTQYSELLELEQFSLIFKAEREQEVLLCRFLLLTILRRSYAVMGSSLDEGMAWLTAVPDHVELPLPFELDGRVPQGHREWLALMRQLSLTYFGVLARNLGETVASRHFENGYAEVAQSYQGLETFPVVIGILPESILDEQKISLLSHRQIQRALLDNVDHLEEVNSELGNKYFELEKTQRQLIAAREEALRSSMQFRSVLDTVAEGILTFDENGRIVIINQELLTIWGYEEDELVGDNIQRLFSPKGAAVFEFDLNPNGALVAGIRDILGKTIEIEGQRKNGRRFPLEVRIAETQVGDRTWYTAAVSDITDRKRAELAMAHARDLAIQTSELKTRIMASVSHDLRTPLNAMLGYADMLIENVYGDLNDSQLSVVERIMLSGTQMATLIGDLLDQTQLEGGQLKLQAQPFEPAVLLQNTLTILAPTAKEKGLKLKSKVDKALPKYLVGDSQRLQQILTNLAGNAIKFTDEGEVKVRFYAVDADHWALEVADTGLGIPKFAHQRIFEPFQQEGAPSQGKQQGFGLGLSIVKQMVEIMNGTITLVSEPGQGSTFTVTLPRISENEEIAP